MRVNPSADLALTANGREVKQVKSFTYLGSIVTTDGGALEGAHNRIKKANWAFVQLYPLWKNRNILVRTRIRLFNTNVKPVLLHECETWKIAKRISDLLKVFVNRCLRRILNVKWPDIITNGELWQRMKQTPIEEQIKEGTWRWIGHTLRKPQGATERHALDWNPPGNREEG
jgi:hypothetical protein